MLRTSMTGLGDGRGEEAAAEAREGGSSPASGALTVARSPPAPTARPQEDPGLAGLPPLPGAQPARIRVLVRKRPLNAKERRQREADVVAVQGPAQLAVHEARVKVDLTQYAETHRFVFDEVLDEGATGDAVYAAAVEPLLRTVFSRGKASVFACARRGGGGGCTEGPGRVLTRPFDPAPPAPPPCPCALARRADGQRQDAHDEPAAGAVRGRAAGHHRA